MKNKKSTPEGALIPQDNGTTSGEKSEAERWFDKIGTGAAYALKRPKDPIVDRQLRRLIESANNNDDCIINVGFGYFRPGDDDSDDFETYLAAERSKIRSRLKTLSKMEQTYDRRYQ